MVRRELRRELDDHAARRQVHVQRVAWIERAPVRGRGGGEDLGGGRRLGGRSRGRRGGQRARGVQLRYGEEHAGGQGGKGVDRRGLVHLSFSSQ